MDPRPYTYEYRKPRNSNPTFFSQNLYESIYHLGSYGKKYAPIERNSPPPRYLYQPQTNNKQSYKPHYEKPKSQPKYHPQQHIHERVESQRYNMPQKMQNKPVQRHLLENEIRMRQQRHPDERRSSAGNENEGRNYSVEVPKLPPSRSQHYMSNYGNRLMQPIPGKDQDRIYERQEKQFNIVTNYPKEYGNIHRKYPKITLENKLLEKGMYPYNNQQER